jgi:hypothetical protein
MTRSGRRPRPQNACEVSGESPVTVCCTCETGASMASRPGIPAASCTRSAYSRAGPQGDRHRRRHQALQFPVRDVQRRRRRFWILAISRPSELFDHVPRPAVRAGDGGERLNAPPTACTPLIATGTPRSNSISTYAGASAPRRPIGSRRALFGTSARNRPARPRPRSAPTDSRRSSEQFVRAGGNPPLLRALIISARVNALSRAPSATVIDGPARGGHRDARQRLAVCHSPCATVVTPRSPRFSRGASR